MHVPGVEGVGKGTNKRLSIERIYQKKSQIEHILLRPDSYIGSVEKVTQVTEGYIRYGEITGIPVFFTPTYLQILWILKSIALGQKKIIIVFTVTCWKKLELVGRK